MDINNIVKQYTLQCYRIEDFKNFADRVFSDARRFVDCTNFQDLQTASNMMIEAEASFIQNVPAKIREQHE